MSKFANILRDEGNFTEGAKGSKNYISTGMGVVDLNNKVIQGSDNLTIKSYFDKAIDDAKKDKSSFQKGFKEGQAKAKPKSNAPKKSSSSSRKSGESAKGGFKGAGTGSSAFK